jgi:hypothetical protein
LITLGIILLTVLLADFVLAVPGMAGHAVGGRRHCY